MSAKRITIGRTFSQSPVIEKDENGIFSQTFTLSSGERVTFTLETIPAAELASRTFVTLENNGRDQEALTVESLKDITRTIKLQQFFPAIGRRIDGRVEILDGSRRRAAALVCQTDLNVLVTDTEISADDARLLAKDIQTAREHNLREVGLRLTLLRNSGMSQKDIAESQRLSASKVTRAIQAASVPSTLLKVFPEQSELTYPDYRLLMDVHEQLAAKGENYDKFVSLIEEEKKNIIFSNILPADELKNEILQIFRRALDGLQNKPDKARIITRKLWKFDDKDRFARKKTKGRTFSYEFSRLSRELEEDLDQIIYQTIQKHLSS